MKRNLTDASLATVVGTVIVKIVVIALLVITKVVVVAVMVIALLVITRVVVVAVMVIAKIEAIVVRTEKTLASALLLVLQSTCPPTLLTLLLLATCPSKPTRTILLPFSAVWTSSLFAC